MLMYQNFKMFSTQIDVDVLLTKDKRGYSVHLLKGSEMKIPECYHVKGTISQTTPRKPA